ncbi:cilia- and flagella-associated protein 251 isoform X2 [Phyllobates terribilis]|uniref:cilia- and flagella-associated protein 251 isoform X2 n=1 Tax=Phyllobates terribilis TaxID=111132 RepID=UPI003CCB5EBB
MSEGNSDLQEVMSSNAVDQDSSEKETEECNEDQKISPTPESSEEQPPDANDGDFEEQVNEPVTEEEGSPYVEMFHDVGKKEAIEPDVTDEETLQNEKAALDDKNPAQESREISDNNITESQWSSEGNNCVSVFDDMNEDAEDKAVVEVPAAEDSLVYTATPRTAFEDENSVSADKPLNLAWCFGMNSNIPIYNLHDEEHQVAVYVCAHTAVIHDFTLNLQRHLQGHCSCISCLCVSQDRRWIVTGDQGPESLIIVWDSFSEIPVHTIFQSHPHEGVIAIAMSHNAKYLATIGGRTVQKVCIWDWTTGSETPICTAELKAQFGLQKYIIFNPIDETQLITNSDTQVIFYSWDNCNLEYVAPPLNDKTFNKAVGAFSQSVFDFRNVRSLTATSAGKLVVWETTNTPLIRTKSAIKPHNKKALKLMHLQKDAITVLTTHDRYFVTGDTRGHVKFYDQQLQLVHWYSHLNLTPIHSMSFSKCPPMGASEKTRYPEDCSIKGDQFAISNFIVSTSDGMVLHVFTDGTMLKKVLQEPTDAVHALACHPNKTQVAVGSYNGILKVWDYKDRKSFISRIFGKDKSLHCLAYDPSGSFLAAGFTDGSINILDAVTLEDETKEQFKYAKGSITHVTFSHNSQYLATADQEFTVTLLQQMKQTGGGRASWEFFARYRSHYKPIQNLIFGIHLDSSEPRLLSLGVDRMLVEYDLTNSSKDHIIIQSNDRIDQSAIPQCVVWYPPFTKESFILVANDEYKLKLYNATTKMCRKTLLGPTFGSPIRKMEVFPSYSQDSGKGYLAYIIDDKVGLQILPVDGNPHKTMALICHPDGVANIACSSDGQYVFTAGGKDCTVMMWKTNVQSLEAVASLGGEDLIPFYGMLPGGRDGALFKELEDYFYYAQLRNQSIDTMETRKVSTHIPLKEVPFIMRALGYYPTEQEMENMLNEVKFSEYVNTGQQVTHINLGDFIKLYINHRPAFGVCLKELQQAFQVLGFSNENGEQTINRGQLLQLLQTKGEHMTEEELADYLSTLLGLNPEGGSSELGTSKVTGTAERLEQEIPEEITTVMFARDILGFPVNYSEDPEEQTQNPEIASC